MKGGFVVLQKKVLEIAGLLVFLFAQNTCATLIEITVDTDKDVYQLGNYVDIYVTAYNPNPEPVILNFSTSMQASYILDDTYNWGEYHGHYPMFTKLTIPSFDSFTWQLIHGSEESATYPLDVGLHTLVGEVLALELIGNSKSEEVYFEVIPEPATILLFGIGWLALRRKRG